MEQCLCRRLGGEMHTRMADRPFVAEYVYFTNVGGGGLLIVDANGSVGEHGAATWQCGICCEHLRREEVSDHAMTRHLPTPQVEIQVPGSEVMEHINDLAGVAVGLCGNCGTWANPATHTCG